MQIAPPPPEHPAITRSINEMAKKLYGLAVQETGTPKKAHRLLSGVWAITSVVMVGHANRVFLEAIELARTEAQLPVSTSPDEEFVQPS